MNRLLTTPILGASTALLLIGFLQSPAQAYHRSGYHHRSTHHHISYGVHSTRMRAVSGGCVFNNDGRQICNGVAPAQTAAAYDSNGNRAYAAYASIDEGSIIGARPPGCPHAYCGCGLRKYLGLADARLNLASNWARLFPREGAPRAGLAAVRSGHVMYIEASAGNGHWLIRDYNSGGGLSRLHVRDLRGYVFVNPRG
ncbi:MAG TPA: hypothetical protein VFW22_16675 [Pseudolabrys sp.]|nr:hypothetical protein [Pseudolabrys sp.]